MSSTTATPAPQGARFAGFESLMVRITVHVGAARMTIDRLSSLKVGDVVPLERAVGAPFDLRIGELWLGRVEPLAIEDRLGLKLVDCDDDPDARPS